MKKLFLTAVLTTAMLTGGAGFLLSQEMPNTQPDTVNIDTDAKPTFYYAEEDEETGSRKGSNKGSFGTIAIIATIVVVAAGAMIVFLKKKK